MSLAILTSECEISHGADLIELDSCESHAVVSYDASGLKPV